MVDLSLYQLEPPPGGGFHFGEEGLELEASSLCFASDSLFAALVAALAEQRGAKAADDFVAPFAEGKPPFLLASVFPYVGRLPLLPLPHLQIVTEKPMERKFAKKTKFVSPQILARLRQGTEMDDVIDEAGNGRFLQNGAIWLTAAEQAHLPQDWPNLAASALRHQTVWQQGSVPRVTLDRVSSTSNIYLMGRVNFNQGCGLWFGVEYVAEGWRERVETLLHHLGDRGIGGERANGYGAFTPRLPAQLEPPLRPIPGEDNMSHRLLLSRYAPQEGEIAALQDDGASYQLVRVGGWLASPQHESLRRKRATLLSEGSVVGQEVQGRLVDVTPDYDGFPHPVYRYGLALTVGVQSSS